MAKDPLIDWLTRLGQWAEELSKTITDAAPPEPPKPEPAQGPWRPGYDAELRGRLAHVEHHNDDLKRMIDRSRVKLQRVLERYHGAESRPTADVPFDQLIETVVKTIDGEIGQGKGFPKQVVPTNDATLESLRGLIRDMEAQQLADTRLIASQAREIEVLSGKIQRVQAGEGKG
jgi:hypothetical protein